MSHAKNNNRYQGDNPHPTLRERMSQDLQLQSLADRTHDGYLREVAKLAGYYMTPPDQLTEQQVADYLLYLINQRNYAPGSLRVTYSGIKFFYTFTVPRDWPYSKSCVSPSRKRCPMS